MVWSQVGKRQGLEIINIMNNDGRLNEAAGKFCGLTGQEARKAIWAALEVNREGR